MTACSRFVCLSLRLSIIFLFINVTHERAYWHEGFPCYVNFKSWFWGQIDKR